jgi:hypothetical protein
VTKPFLSFQIDRYGDTARVQVLRITDDGEAFKREVIADYETASRGATASAKREMRKHRA